MPCPSCASPVPDGARFCPSCGVAVTITPLEERRVVTVLFADVVGFTGLAEHRDPEQVKRMIDSCFQRLVLDVDAFGGRVDKILGDGIIALFGAPIAHEDDAERAVRAALRMLETAEDHARRTGSPMRLRIGINTGEVLVGALRAGGDYTAMGDVVNLAARLQAEAPSSSVLVGPATHALTEKVISYEEFGDVVIRGREHGTSAWLAVGVVAPPGGHRHRQHTPFTGREEELALLCASVELSIARRRAVLIAVEGEGGVGKSRLAEEVLERVAAAHDVLVLEGSCVPYGESNVWWPVASALLRRLGLDSAADPEDVRVLGEDRARRVLGVTASPAEVTRVAEAFLHLLGAPSTLEELEPARAREEVVRAVTAVLQGRARRGPIVVAITDVHWADPAVLTLFEQVLVGLAGSPFVLLTTARPDSELDWPPVSGRYTTTRLRLETLDREDSIALAERILGDAANEEMVERLFERSGGNPLFLEELAALVADSGAVGDLPGSLRALVSARLDQLPPDQRVMIDNAAVLGSSGPWSALARFGEVTGRPADVETLNGLVAGGLLAIDGRRWRFRSESVREVAYQTLTKASRAVRHVGVASAMEEGGKASAEDIAHHYATAAELVQELGPINHVPRNVASVAVRWLTEAAERAVDQMSSRVGVRAASRGLDLLEGVGGDEAALQRCRLLLVRADGLTDLRRVDRARDDLTAALADATRRGDRSGEASAYRLSGEVERLSGRPEAARADYERAITLWRDIGDERELARALRARGFLEIFSGAPIDAEAFLAEADAMYERLGDRGGRAWVVQHRAWMSFLAGRIDEAEARLHQAVATMTEVGDRGGLGWAFGLLAFVRFYAGDREESSQIAQRVLSEALERGDDWAAGMMQSLQSNLALWEGRTDEAVALAEQSRNRMRKLGDRFGEVQALAAMLRANVALGRAPAVAKLSEELSVAAVPHGLEGFAQLARAGTLLLTGASDRVIEAIGDSLEQAERRGGIGVFDALVIRSIAYLMNGRIEEALADLDRAEAEHPATSFGNAAAALAASLDRRPRDALEHAAKVSATIGVTYLDRIYGALASASAHRQCGDEASVRFALDEARFVVSTVGDRMAQSLVVAARAAFGVVDGDDVAGGVELGGWSGLVRRLADVSPLVPSI